MHARVLLHGFCVVAYFACWMVVAAGVLLLAVGLVWELYSLSEATGLDDDVVLLAAPLGAILGILLAGLTRHRRTVHWLLIGLGLVLPVIGAAGAYHMFQASQTLQGVRGPFSGLAEAMAALLAVGIAVMGLFLLGAGLFGRLHPHHGKEDP